MPWNDFTKSIAKVAVGCVAIVIVIVALLVAWDKYGGELRCASFLPSWARAPGCNVKPPATSVDWSKRRFEFVELFVIAEMTVPYTLSLTEPQYRGMVTVSPAPGGSFKEKRVVCTTVLHVNYRIDWKTQPMTVDEVTPVGTPPDQGRSFAVRWGTVQASVPIGDAEKTTCKPNFEGIKLDDKYQDLALKLLLERARGIYRKTLEGSMPADSDDADKKLFARHLEDLRASAAAATAKVSAHIRQVLAAAGVPVADVTVTLRDRSAAEVKALQESYKAASDADVAGIRAVDARAKKP